jgi:hypothetical protein
MKIICVITFGKRFRLSVQNKTARVQQKKESKLIKTKQSFNKSPDTHEHLHSQKPESFSESNDSENMFKPVNFLSFCYRVYIFKKKIKCSGQ